MGEKYLRAVIFSSVVIMLYQGISNSDLGVLSQLTEQNGNVWAGPLSTSLLFLGSGLGSIYNAYIGKRPYKYCFYFGSYGYLLFVGLGCVFIKLGFSPTVEVLIFVVSFVAGLFCSVFYNTQFNYINALAKIDGREVKYFGINMALAQTSTIIGNIISALLIKPLGQFLTVLVMTIIIFFVSLFFLLFRQPQQQQLKAINSKNQESRDKTSNDGSLISSQEQSTALRNPGSPYWVCSAFAFSGIIITFIFTLTSIILYRTFEDNMDKQELNRLTFILFIFEGVGEFLGGMAMIYLSPRIKDISKAIIITSSIFMFSVLVMLLGSRLESAYIIGAGLVLTGFGDCSTFALALALAGEWKQAGITAFNFSQSSTVAVTAIITVFVPFEISILWIGLFYICCLVAMWLYSRRTQRQGSNDYLMKS